MAKQRKTRTVKNRKNRRSTRRNRRTYGGAWYDPRSWFAPKSTTPELVRQTGSRNLLRNTRRNANLNYVPPNAYNNNNNNFNPNTYRPTGMASYGLGYARR